MPDCIVVARFSGAAEQISGTRVGPQRMVVDSHPLWAPFAPCDVVSIRDGAVVAVVEWAPTFTVVAHLPPEPGIDAESLAVLWNVSSYATAIGPDQVMVTTYNQRWPRDAIEDHPAVAWVSTLRTPRDVGT